MIYNITKKKILSKKVKFANNLFSQGVGLMFKPKIDYGLVFNLHIANKWNIITWFMKFPIDIIFLDSEKRVTVIFHKIKPWKSDISGLGKYVIELPAGKSLNTEIGDKISFK